jgi:chromosome segregation ATPase
LEILSLAQIYPDGHNIILQGDVTQIIEMNPVERRFVIDEVSGIAEYNDKKEKAQKDLEAVDAKLKEAEIIITERYDIYKKLENERNAAIRYQNLQQQLRVLRASLAHKKQVEAKQLVEKVLSKLSAQEELSKKVSEELEKVEAELDLKEKAIREVAGKIINMSKRVEMEKEISEVRSQLLIKKNAIETNLREIERLTSIIEKLETIAARREEVEIPRAVQAILKLNLRGVYGTIANLITVDDEYRVAVEVAAGPHLYDIVVDTDETAAYCIEYLRREKIGRAAFLPLNKIKPTIFKEHDLLKKPGVIGVCSKLIKFDSKFLPAIEFVFGNTLLVENLEAARSVGIGKARMVTLEGDLIERSGAMIGGYYVKTHPKILESSTQKEIERYVQLKKDLEKEVSALQEDVKKLEKRLNELAKSEAIREFIDLEKLKVVSEREVDELREKRKKLQMRKVNLEIEINRLNIEKAKLEAELSLAQQESAQYEDVQNFIDEKISVLENFIHKTEKELQSIGAVNLKAIEEYEKFKSEFDRYKERYEKILEEKKAVLEMIEQIEQKRKEVFSKTLQEISNHFNNIFNNMTGGTASLQLENSDDIESGLLIQANPKGKRLLNIDAMSGGEKALAALAFLFAVQFYKPAPFYIFDEVDAALDKENTKKISEWIKRASKEAQFIIITHNEQTIKYGDRVYGVTMDRGESKILGIELPKE